MEVEEIVDDRSRCEQRARSIDVQDGLSRFFIGVHAGAGYHGATNAPAFKRALKRALLCAARTLLPAGGRDVRNVGPTDAVVAAIASLEADPVTNAGFGSALTLHGKVECDASVMGAASEASLSDGGFGAVGAVSGVRSPITLAHAIMTAERKGRLPLGRVPPMFLVGEGARRWGLAHGVEGVLPLPSSPTSHLRRKRARHETEKRRDGGDDDDKGEVEGESGEDEDPMVAPRARAAWEKYSARLRLWAELEERKERRRCGADEAEGDDGDNDGGGEVHRAKRPKTDLAAAEAESDSLYDTVGAICIDATGKTAAGVSSGGIAMKWEGRVGEAALYGCGCWASGLDLNPSSSSATPRSPRVAVACSASGVGEQITKSLLASTACREMVGADEADVGARRALEHFFAANAREGDGTQHAGFIALRATTTSHSGRSAEEGEEEEGGEEDDDAAALIEGDLVVAHSTESMAYGFIDHTLRPRVYISRLGRGEGKQCCVVHPFHL